MSAPTRRGLLGGAAVLAGASSSVPSATSAAAPTPAYPDAELLVACADYRRIWRAFDAYLTTLPGNIGDDDPAWAMLAPIDALQERIIALRATTADGHLARGLCFGRIYLPNHHACQDDPDAAVEDRFRAAMLRDLVKMERGVQGEA